jgi:biopolymer transport protein ExbB/TolQ
MSTTKPRNAFSANAALAGLAATLAAAPAHAGPSFATAFFITLDQLPDGSVRVDWIGSTMIWALIAMSIASVALIWIAFAANRVEDMLPPASVELVVRRLRRIEVLNVFGQVAPMIGLFGTVYGMIVAFFTIAQSGGTADPVALAGGIGTALVTTFWGLLIAIPALSTHAVVRNRIDSAGTEGAREVEQICARFRPGSGTSPVAAMRHESGDAGA